MVIGVAFLLRASSFAQAPSFLWARPDLPVVTPVALSAATPEIDCAKLAETDVSGAVGAKTYITSAAAITNDKPTPHCRVNGYVEPMVKFEVRLPLTTWTQRFVQTGCGGLCGNLDIRLGNADGCYPADHGGEHEGT